MAPYDTPDVASEEPLRTSNYRKSGIKFVESYDIK